MTTEAVISTHHQRQMDILKVQSEANPDCSRCRQFLEEGLTLSPRHTASVRCQSGRRSHCSCETCF